jgi:hypothetical protein
MLPALPGEQGRIDPIGKMVDVTAPHRTMDSYQFNISDAEYLGILLLQYS